MEALAVTGYGIASPLGVGKAAFEKALAKGDAGRFFRTDGPISGEQTIKDACVAWLASFEAKDYLGNKGLRNLDRLTKLLVVAAKYALEDAKIKSDGKFIALSPEQVGLCSSTAYGSLEAITELKLVAELEDPRYLNPARFPNTVINAAAGYVSIWEDLQAPNVTLVNGNCGALDAVLSAGTHLEHLRGDAFLIGGGEAISEALYLAFDKLGAVAHATQKFAPGDPQSEGMRIGEGAAYLCVERQNDAKARQATIEANITGYGSAFEVPRSEVEIVHGSSLAVKRAISGAMIDAGVGPSDIDLVCSSLSGIPLMDNAELSAIDELFGSSTSVVAPKALWGETLGASGALGLAATVAWLGGVPLCAVLRQGSSSKMKRAVVTTMGYYGNVSAVVMEGVK
ncbi:MAG: hypothetical protein IPJ88_06765 [Myxococcales bacterium]|nr:MAG: hypothetical protein IPJ88_06765 [Myxococcales bacterium]